MSRVTLEEEPSVAEVYRTGSRTPSGSGGGIPESGWPLSWREVAFKDLVQLPEFKLRRAHPTGVRKLIARHASDREFGQRPVRGVDVSALLEALTINRPDLLHAQVNSRRTYPSAGGRYPVDTYLILLRSRDPPPGAYLYDPRRHALRQIVGGNLRTQVRRAFGEAWVARSGLIVCLAAQWARTEMKYGERGLRLTYLEAGHMAQNLILTARDRGLVSCAVAGLAEGDLERMLHLVPPEETPIYSVVIGTRRRSR